jgi:hypothetical protein
VAPSGRPGAKATWRCLPSSDDRIVLLNPDLGPPRQPFYNLLRVDGQGNLIWRAELPASASPDRHDGFVEIRWEGSNIAANTWSGWYALIDPGTGKIREQEFVK